MKLVLKKYQINIWVLAVMMFSATALYTSETAMLYILITGLCSFYSIIQMCKKPSIFRSLVNLKGFLWTTFFCVIIVIDATFRTQTGEMNFDFILFSWISISIVAIIFLSCKTTQELIRVFSFACEIAAIAVCGFILITEASGIIREDGRLGEALSGNVITVSMHLGLYSIGIFYLFLSTKKKLHLGIYVICCIFMLLTGSKISIFYFACVAMYYLKNCSPNNKGKRVLLLVVIVAIVVILIFNNQQLYNVIGKRIIDFLGTLGLVEKYEYSNSTIEREYLLKLAFREFLKSPVFGQGFNTVAAHPPFYVYSHNNYLELLANNGLLGFFAYYGIYISQLVQNRRFKKVEPDMIFLLTLLSCDLLRDVTQIVYTAGWLCYCSVIFGSVYLMMLKKERKYETFAKTENN